MFNPSPFTVQQHPPPGNFQNGNALFGPDDAALDELIASATRPAKVEEPKKSSKKDKDKNSRMVYSDSNVSPEERMATLRRFAG
jgi:hypothetical protein